VSEKYDEINVMQVFKFTSKNQNGVKSTTITVGSKLGQVNVTEIRRAISGMKPGGGR
jgi:hypothetical protein